METYYSLPEIAKLVQLEYNAVYAQIKQHHVPVKRLPGKRKEQLYITRSDLACFFMQVDWLMVPACKADHPFSAERQLFEQTYIHRNDLARQLGYQPRYILQLVVYQGFPKMAVRNGWYPRAQVLRWLFEHRPHIYKRINGVLQ